MPTIPPMVLNSMLHKPTTLPLSIAAPIAPPAIDPIAIPIYM